MTDEGLLLWNICGDLGVALEHISVSLQVLSNAFYVHISLILSNFVKREKKTKTFRRYWIHMNEIKRRLQGQQKSSFAELHCQNDSQERVVQQCILISLVCKLF